MSPSLTQPNSIVLGSTLEGTGIEQITSCVCPTMFWSGPLGCRKIVGGATKIRKQHLMNN